jgi:hypothetical protein
MFSIRAQAGRLVTASVILAAQLLSPEARAAQFFQWLTPVVGGQVRISQSSSRTFADAVEGRDAGRLDTTGGRSSPAETNSFWVGFQIPTELKYSLSEVTISGNWGGLFVDFMGASFRDLANPAVLPAIGETWNGLSDSPHIVQLASELANGTAYGGFSRTVAGGSGPFGGAFTVQGSDAMVANLLAKEGGLLYLGVIGGGGGESSFLSLSGLSLQLYTDEPNVSVAPLPAAGWLFGSAVVALVGWTRRRRVVPVTSASA